MQEIRLDTIRALHARNHELAAYCALPAMGGARSRAADRGGGAVLLCPPQAAFCGEPGMWQLRPSVYRNAAGGVTYAANDER
jgi:hypothetical protein